jgi:hypothetical protein
VIIPWLKFFGGKLFCQFRIVWAFKRSKLKIRRTLNDWLTFAIKRKNAIMTLISSELFSRSDDCQSFTISHKYCALAWSYKDSAIFRIIYVEISGYIKDKILGILTVIYIVLLLFDGINLFYFEAIDFIFISIIVWVVFLFHNFRLQNISLKRRLHRLFSFLYQRNLLSYLFRSFDDHLTCRRLILRCNILFY